MSTIPVVTLPEGPILMDGGMGQELIRRGQPEGPYWSAQALIDTPDMVREVHEDYIRAGARIILTNTYAVVRRRFGESEVPDRFVALSRLACEMARLARDNTDPSVLIAGSLPPIYGSYRPDLTHEFDTIEPLYREQAEVLAPHVDFFICETMSTAEEARGAVAGAASIGKPIWVAWTIADDDRACLRSGESLAEAWAALDGLPVSGLLLNCSSPEAITAAMPVLAGLSDWPVGGYANGFKAIPENWLGPRDGLDALGKRQDLTPDAYAEIAAGWIEAGARLIGGCCEIGPAHISRLHDLIPYPMRAA
jgi:S-methylmethionine-dependent homocysteine/selenocysteine methylase